MSRRLLIRGLLGVAMMVLAISGVSRPAQAQRTITFSVACPDGITDAPFTVDLTVQKPDGGTETVNVYIPIHSTSEDAALLIAVALDLKGIPATHPESTNKSPKFPADEDQRKKEIHDLVLPVGYKLKGKIRIKRNGTGADDQLKAYVGSKKVSTQDSSIEFQTLSISVFPDSGYPVELMLEMYEIDAETGVVLNEWRIEAVHAFAPSHILVDVGDWLEDLGAVVAYPEASRITVQLPVGMGVNMAFFGANEYSPGAGGASTFEVAFEFEAQ